MAFNRDEARALGLTKLLPPGDPWHDADATTGTPGGRNKYRAVATTYNGVRYDSKAEAVRAERLDWEQSAGLVVFWYPHPRFRLGVPENVYVADFLVLAPGDRLWVEDVKGVRTAKFERDVRLWRSYGPCPLRVLVRGKVVEVVEPETGTVGGPVVTVTHPGDSDR